MSVNNEEITADILLEAYRQGVFPMADDKDDPRLYWYRPEERGILPLDEFHLSRRLARTVLANPYEVKVDTDFLAVIDACAHPTPQREQTWINQPIRSLFFELYERGHAHTVEVWDKDHLVGGLYGLSIGQAFFGESMFSRKTDTSKIALVHLVARLRLGHFQLLDTQFMTSHLAQFGGLEIKDLEYETRLYQAITRSGHWLNNEWQADIFQEIKAMRASR
ncbi:leucyl/phenylalanyl-tRNA--protein transferase [Commensalibacter communis]|uniref:leucyl/phenylalanyl-tRNA--protein transferase n=1 Tax=Commensalibacter communis TaxID=2972786 RepID=UPI0022FF5C13|nr:leucyl/phenylalanyl-tRNA--protein transferase [Commensalibacter communis]CAI3924365.1 Leu/Phe-tRNA-protein transferase (Aat) (PDB:2CXA) [Commensalibacter communis]CAI3930335.1 Leu/Phe-tRNA-protein transferase (Aat) (PDB:2CXA) [Commensalibacter communis]